ncbi:MAG: hypothetical protein K2P22_00920 [Lachnospiraceae bacterium]|nr:hypothetical protein [Lachnospiraceae bacterium]
MQTWELEQQDSEGWMMDDPEHAREKQHRLDWSQAFPEPKLFCKNYLLLRDLYFDTRLPNPLPQMVEQALDVFL